MLTIINFNHDGEALHRITPQLDRAKQDVSFIIEHILSNDEAMFKEEWASTLVHSDRDRLTEHLTDYLLVPIRKALNKTYMYNGTPESLSAIVEQIRKEMDSSDVAQNCQIDWEGLEYTYTIVNDDQSIEERTSNASELLVDSVAEVIQLKLSKVYKDVTATLVSSIEKAITRGTFKRAGHEFHTPDSVIDMRSPRQILEGAQQYGERFWH